MSSAHALLRLASFVLLTAFAIQGCAPQVQTIAKVKPKAEEAAGLRRVAVMGFRGPQSEMAGAAFETMLVKHQYNGEPYFTVVDRHQTGTVMGEVARSLTGEVDPKTATRYGKQLGVEGVYFADIVSASVNPRHYEAQEKYCRRTNSSGRKCRDWGTRTVRCLERNANVTVMPRLVDVETGRVVYRAEHVGQSSTSSCGGDGDVPDSQLMEQALRQALEQIRSDIAPSEVRTYVSLMNEPSSLGAADTAEFMRGLAFAQAQRVDRACEIWRALNARLDGNDNALLFNVAICSETEGDPATALRILEDVDRRLDAPDRNVSAALARVQSALAMQ